MTASSAPLAKRPLATCDAALPRLAPGALLTRGARIEWVGEERAPAGGVPAGRDRTTSAAPG